MTPEEMATIVKQAANTFYALGWDQVKASPDQRQSYRVLSEKLDQVTKALGGNPMSPAWQVPGNPRQEAEPPRPSDPAESKVTDLMDALEKSLERIKTEPAERKPRCQVCDWPEDVLHHQGQGKGAHTFLGPETTDG